MEYILASANKHKVEELNELFKDSEIRIMSQKSKLEVIEDGGSFRANAQLKAEAYYNKFGKASVSDDSGLVVNALPDLLGVESANFAPELPEYSDKCKKLIELLKDKEDRSAYFVCYLCFYKSPSEIYFFEGRVPGEIGYELKGDTGFGYDPIFLPKGRSGKSLAQESEWKMTNSHRAKACAEAINFKSLSK